MKIKKLLLTNVYRIKHCSQVGSQFFTVGILVRDMPNPKFIDALL